MSKNREYTPRTVIASQRRVLAWAGSTIRQVVPRGRRDMLFAIGGTLLTAMEVLEHIDAARRLKVKR